MKRISCWTVCAVLCVHLAASSTLAAERSQAKPSAPAAKGPSAAEILKRLKPEHPRLMIDATGFKQLQEQVKSDATLRDWAKQVQADADKLLKARTPEHVIPDGLRLLATSRDVLHRCTTLGMAHRLTGDKRYAERLWSDVEAVSKFPDFNPRHFLDTGEMTHALAIAYDWLYDTWTDSQRATIRKAIVEMGLKPGLDVYRKGQWWAKATHNWNQVCNGGMTIGALAIADEEPALAGEIVASAIASVPLAMASYGPDGAWDEGPGYWAYATSYNVYMLAALESALGTDYGLSKIPGFAETGLFPIYMVGPSGKAFNFEDSGDRVGRSDCLLWLARKFDLPACTWFAGEDAKPSARYLLWYAQPGKDPAAAELPLDKYWRRVEVVAMRGRWNDPKTTFVGIQAGSNTVNHNHIDTGSFVLDALGQRWAVDLGADDYNLPGYFGKARYTYYRLRGEGHNGLVINPDEGPDQVLKAGGKITRFVSKPDWAVAVADLTPVYAPHVKKAERGVALLNRREVLVQDEIDAKSADVWWFMHTGAKIQISEDGRTAALEQQGQKLTAKLVSPAAAKFEERPAEPLPSSPNPEKQRSNKEFRKLAVHLPGTTSVRLTVLFTPVDGKPESSAAAKVLPLAQW